jgi:hypothetical protein
MQLAIALGVTTTAAAEVKEVIVGVTMTCPYENAIEGNCFSGAHLALLQIEGVKSVDQRADSYNCTARVQLEKNALPDPDEWKKQFTDRVGQACLFRGIEVTVVGAVEASDGGLALRVGGIERPIKLQPLQHKLQWNARKGAARQPEPDERDAYDQLFAKKDAPGNQLSSVRVTGPLLKTETGLTVEVREFFLPTATSTKAVVK